MFENFNMEPNVSSNRRVWQYLTFYFTDLFILILFDLTLFYDKFFEKAKISY